jgi:hypothetical protein
MSSRKRADAGLKELLQQNYIDIYRSAYSFSSNFPAIVHFPLIRQHNDWPARDEFCDTLDTDPVSAASEAKAQPPSQATMDDFSELCSRPLLSANEGSPKRKVTTAAGIESASTDQV